MNIKSLFKKKTGKEDLVIVFDIGNASIGGAFVSFSPEHSPQILYSVRKQFPTPKKANFENLSQSLQRTFTIVLSNLEKEGIIYLSEHFKKNITFKHAFCILSSPWYASHMRTISFSRDDEFQITSAFLSKILQSEIKNMKDSQSDRYIKAGIAEDNIILLEKEIIRIKLNGYKIENPFNRIGTRLEMLLYLSISPKNIIDDLEEKIQNTFHIKEITFHSFVFVFFNIMRDMANEKEDFILIDISGEMTEVSLVKESALLETITFPLGKSFFIRHIMEKTKISHAEASSLINLYFKNKGNENIQKQIFNALEESKEKWLERLKEVFLHFSDGILIPKDIFLTSDKSLGPWFVKALKDFGFNPSVPTEKFSTPRLIDHETLSSFIKVKKGVELDNFLIIDSMFANKIYYLDK